jgi:peptidoglycan/xylan/chitin deacetylase (PgdA/CDA1 family)
VSKLPAWLKRRSAASQPANPELLILRYHIVDDATRPADPEHRIAPDMFARQIAELKNQGFETITLAHWTGGPTVPAELPARPLVLTFDDADRRTLSTVLPVLSAAGFVATVFVVTGAVGSTNRWDEAAGLPRRTLASERELLALGASGWEIGSLGRTHRSLSALSDDDLRNEVTLSRSDLESRLAKPVTSFAYPYGDYDRRVIVAVREAGYIAACGWKPGINDARTDAFALRRMLVAPSDDLAGFTAKLGDAHDQRSGH